MATRPPRPSATCRSMNGTATLNCGANRSRQGLADVSISTVFVRMDASPSAKGTSPRISRLRPTSSVALEHRPALVHERLVGALVILRLHADRLRLRLGLDGVVDAHAP